MFFVFYGSGSQLKMLAPSLASIPFYLQCPSECGIHRGTITGGSRQLCWMLGSHLLAAAPWEIKWVTIKQMYFNLNYMTKYVCMLNRLTWISDVTKGLGLGGGMFNPSSTFFLGLASYEPFPTFLCGHTAFSHCSLLNFLFPCFYGFSFTSLSFLEYSVPSVHQHHTWHGGASA